MTLPLLLLATPLATALLLSALPAGRARAAVTVAGAVTVIVLSLLLAGVHFHGPSLPADAAAGLDRVLRWTELLLGALLLWGCVRARRWLALALLLLQFALLAGMQHAGQPAGGLVIDKLAVIMALVIGLGGGLIAVYALGYMRDYRTHHPEVRDRERLLLVLLFTFLSAMFLIVFADRLAWLYTGWEATTLCSFLLIGYRDDDESRRNAAHALTVNVFGGLCLALGIAWLALLDIDTLGGLVASRFSVWHGAGMSLTLAPALLLCLAALTKSAQFPFSGWLLGAMVAPTPVSALLHASTMVKAGVYLILRLAPLLAGTLGGVLLAITGAVTFVLASCMAVGEENAKRVLALSTVANLGLIVLCGGIGSGEALWAGVLLIIFHAVAKALLFLAVGRCERVFHSKAIAAQAGLVVTMPRTSVLMQIGMAGMFLAPFGMLVSKWAVLKAVVDANPAFAGFIVFGSAATLVFWVQWMGKLLEVHGHEQESDERPGAVEWVPLGTLAVLTIALCAGFPWVSAHFVEPYVADTYGTVVAMSRGNIIIMTIMLGLACLFPLSFINYGRRVEVKDPYLCGGNTGDGTAYRGAAGALRTPQLHSYRFAAYLHGDFLLRCGGGLAAAVIALMLLAGVRGV